MKEGERRHFSEYYDKLQMKILRAIVYLRRNGVPSEQLDCLIEVKSNRALQDRVESIYAGQNRA